MLITTPSGYKVTLKDESDLTFRDRRSIQKVFLANANITAGSSKMDLMASTILDAQDELLKVLLLKIVTPTDEELTGNLFDIVGNWKTIEDAEAVYDVVNSVFTKINNPKKK